MAKKDIISEILSLTNAYSKEDLENLKTGELENILKISKEISDVQEEQTKKTKSLDVLSESPISRKSIPSIDKSQLVPVMNITNGSLVYQSRKTGMEIKFERYGDIEYLEIGELLTMRSSQRRFLDEPWVLILDEETVEYLGLDKLYRKLISPQNIDDIFNFPIQEFEKIIESSPRGYSQLIVSRAKVKIREGALDSVAKIKALEKRFKIELAS
jgi:hypothetical protein